MGGQQSAYNAPLVPQITPICALDTRFCLPRALQLRIREKLLSRSGDDYKITDPSDGTVYFKCAGRLFSLRDKKTLLDKDGVPVLNMKEAIISNNFTIYAQDSSDKVLCKVKAEFTFVKAKLFAHFTDAVTNESRVLVLKGDGTSKTAVIYLGEPKQGGIPVARIFRPLTGRSFLGADEYLLETAPGVDISLLVMLCIALDEYDT